MILVEALDRWGRSVRDLILTMAELEALGVAFVVPGQIDMSTPVGRMQAHLLCKRLTWAVRGVARA